MSTIVREQCAPSTTIPIAVHADDLAKGEAVDVELGDQFESIDVGPFAGAYLRLCAPDLVVAVDAARRLLVLVEEAVLDARQEQMEADRHDCPGCATRLEADEVTCGSARCNRIYAMDGAL